MKLLKLLFFAATLPVASCSQKENIAAPPSECADLHFNCSLAEMTRTKSSYAVREDALKSVSLALYDADGLFYRSGYFTDIDSIRMTAVIGRTYSAYAVFNADGVEFPAHKSDVKDVACVWDGTKIGASGFPSVWTGKIEVTSSGRVVPVQAERFVSKVNFRVDNSGLTDHDGRFVVEKLALRNSPQTYYPFSKTKGTTEGLKGFVSDSTSDADIATLNAGGTASFYTLENRRGTLLPGNTDPWKKVPTCIGTDADRCTYLEVTGRYETDGGTLRAPATYRLYIGRDATTNFSVNRNEIYNVSLCPSDEGIDSTSWKITLREFEDDRYVGFSPDTLKMSLNSSSSFLTVPYPSDMKCTVSGWSDGTRSLTVTSAGDNEWKVTGSGVIAEDTMVHLAATSWDGRVKDSLPVILKSKQLTGLIADCPGYGGAGDWKWDFYKMDAAGKSNPTYTVTAIYDDGTKKTLSASEYSVSDNTHADMVDFDTKGVVKDVGSVNSGGNGTVMFSYTEKGKTATLTKTWWKLYVTGITPYASVYYTEKCGAVVLHYNDGTGETLSNHNLAFTSSSANLVKIVSSGDKWEGLRQGKVTIKSSNYFRGKQCNGTVSCYKRPAISKNTSGPSITYGTLSGTFYYVMEDADGCTYSSGGKITVRVKGDAYTYTGSVSSSTISGLIAGREKVSTVSLTPSGTCAQSCTITVE